MDDLHIEMDIISNYGKVIDSDSQKLSLSSDPNQKVTLERSEKHDKKGIWTNNLFSIIGLSPITLHPFFKNPFFSQM